MQKTNRGVSHSQGKIIEITDEHPEFYIIEITIKISVNILNHRDYKSKSCLVFIASAYVQISLTILYIYIPTVWPIERQRIRKTVQELSKLEDDCTDIWMENWFETQLVSEYTKNKKWRIYRTE